MKRIFTLIAMVVVSLMAMAQINQLVWANGQLLYATPVDRVDSLTYDVSFEGDTLFFIMPHKLVKEVHDTVLVYDTVYEEKIVYVHDTIYIDAPKPEVNKYTQVLGSAVLGDNVEVKGYISAVSSQGAILTDNGGSIFLYKITDVEVGDEVTVSGTISSYNNGFQIQGATVEKTGYTTVTYPEPMELTGAKMDELLTTRTADEYAYYAKMSGTVSVSGYYYNFNVPGAETAVGSVYGATEEVKAALADGMEYTLYGYFCSISKQSGSPKFINIIVTSIELNGPVPIETHEYVDLGLPSGLKWATCNVGANAPEDYGYYFAWGEVELKEYYDWETYKYGTSSYQLTKYCSNSNYGYNGFTDKNTVLDPEDDAATVNWGGAWRMPTKAEQDELRNNCTWDWTTQNGVNGYKVIGPNGNSIFLPAAGYMYFSSLNGAGSYGDYWSSSLCTDFPVDAYFVDFYSDGVDWGSSTRDYGRSVRPVCQ